MYSYVGINVSQVCFRINAYKLRNIYLNTLESNNHPVPKMIFLITKTYKKNRVNSIKEADCRA